MKVLLLDRNHDALRTGLLELGMEVHEAYEMSKEEVMRSMKGVDGIIIRSRFPIDKTFLDASPDLKFIGRVGAGMENIDLEYAEKCGVNCFSAPEGNRNAVGEHALGMLLSLLNNLNRADAEVRRGIWKREANRGLELDGRVVGVIGLGNMGSAFARKLRGFDVEVLAYDKYKKDYGDKWVRAVSLEEIQNRADVVSFHVPIAEDTRYYLDEVFIECMKHPFYLINTARGEVVKTSALVEGMRSGKILGACLDVLEYEKKSFEQLFSKEMPEDFHYLINSDRVILSPHIAGWTQESNKELAYTLVRKIGAWMLE
jgi:D-3-phosphoglycerate dehydrogenase